jgi:glycolate oxidase iron-sulfur subunit
VTELTPTVVSHFDRCLGCMACVTACPSGVKYDALIEQTRAEIDARHPRGRADRWFRRLIFALFPYPRRLRWLLVPQLLYVWSGLRWLVRRLRLLPGRLANLDGLMPPVGVRHLRDRLPLQSKARGPRRGRVALLPGCVQRVYFPGVNEATIRVLASEGFDVTVPAGLGCCGALSVHAGREEEARRFARAAIAELERLEVDWIVVNAAGCGSSMKEWGRLLGDEGAARVAARVRDVSELLAAAGPVAERHPLAVRVAYHDACHLAHAQRIRAQPRALLAAIPELDLGEIGDDACCGSAGIYNLLEPESSREIGLRKVERVLAVRPQILASANPGCTLQIQMLLRERGMTLRIAHPIELLDASIRGVPFDGS